MPRIKIDGVGTVNLDDSFLSLSPEQQNQTIDEIHQQAMQSDGKLTPPADPNQEHAIQPEQAPAPAWQQQPDAFANAPVGNEEVYPGAKWYPNNAMVPEEGLHEAATRPQNTQGQVLENDNTSTMYDMTRGALDEIGTFLGIGAEAWEGLKRTNIGQVLSGQAGLEIKDPGEGITAFKAMLQNLGIPQEGIDNAASRFGSNLVWNTILTGIGIGAGRNMLKPFLDKGGKLMEKSDVLAGKTGVDKFLTSNRYNVGRMFGYEAPGQQMAGAVGGTAGQTYAEETAGESPANSLIGYGVGAATGAKLFRTGVSGAQFAARMFGRGQVTDPIARKFVNPMAVVPSAEDELGRDLIRIENIARQRIEGTKGEPWSGVQPWLYDKNGKATRRMTYEEGQAAFDKELDWAEQTFRKVEDSYWESATDGVYVETQDLKDEASALFAEMSENTVSGGIPRKVFDEIDGLDDAVSARKMQSMISFIYNERKRVTAANSDFAGDKGAYVRNLGLLEDKVRNALASSPDVNKKVLDQARVMTARRKAMFADGPVGESKYIEGQSTSTSVDPTTGKPTTINYSREDKAPHVAKTWGGPRQVQMIQSTFDNLGIKTRIADDFENAVKTDFVNEVGDDPKKMDAWLRKHSGQIGSWKSLLKNIEDQTALVHADMAERKAVSQGVLSRIAGANENTVQTRVNHAFNSTDSKQEIAELTRAFTKDAKGAALPANHDNVETWERLAVNALMRAGGEEAEHVLKLLNDPTWKGNLQTVFWRNPEKLQRLENAVRMALKIQAGDVRSDSASLFRSGATFMAGIFGAKVGSGFNSGSIQVPGYFARSARNYVTKMFRYMLPEPPGEKLYWAITTPEGYNWMTRNVYDNATGFRKAVRQGRRMMGVINTQTHEKERQYLDEMGIRPRE